MKKDQNICFPKEMKSLNIDSVRVVIERALEEDLKDTGDVTTRSVMGENPAEKTGKIIAKEAGVLCGGEVAAEVFKTVDTGLKVEILKKDGDCLEKGDEVLLISGSAASITEAERTALNFLGLMSGVASKTAEYMSLIQGKGLRILDTRKTIPGLREIQKYAVYTGGGSNHRIGLYDMILIKENHIRAVGSLEAAVHNAKSAYPELVIDLEVETLEEVKRALRTPADILMLDNMSDKDILKAVELNQGRKYLEVSGNVTKERLPRIADLGADFVSMGTLTHTVKPLDLSLLF